MLKTDTRHGVGLGLHNAETKAPQLDPKLSALTSLMDEALRIPGTNFRVGLDAIVGLVPVAGDLLTLGVAYFFLKEAERLGASRWTKMRMCGNYGLDLVVGMIPLVGDAFDLGFKAHRRNLRLLQDHVEHQSMTAAPP
jgi:hypothetical protein